MLIKSTGGEIVRKKEGIMSNTIKKYMDLPEDKKMYVLGFMQGILLQNDERQKSQKTKGGSGSRTQSGK